MKKIAMLIPLLSFVSVNSLAFTLYLESQGKFYGPGQAIFSETGTSVKRFRDAEVRNLTFTAPLTGFIPMFNNGADSPNVIAEVLQGEIIDGFTSNGIPINENIDTALHLEITDPVTGEYANIMAVAVAAEDTPDGAELVAPDNKGNITFNPTVYADPGQAELVEKLPRIQFTTGAARVPRSIASQMGLTGGVDAAGPLPSGHVLVGRIGDFDRDGFMDGILVLAGNAPENLVVARGNPIAQHRPWHSDIPISLLDATALTLGGMVVNYPEPVLEALQLGRLDAVEAYLLAIDESLVSALQNVQGILTSKEKPTGRSSIAKLRKVRDQLRQSRADFLSAAAMIEDLHTAHFDSPGIDHRITRKLTKAFELSAYAATRLNWLRERQTNGV